MIRPAFRGVLMAFLGIPCVPHMTALEAQERPAPRAATADLSGRVVGPRGEAVPAAEVVVEALRRVVRTDSLGGWRLDTLPLRTHQLVIRRLGYSPVTRAVELREAGQPVTRVDTLQLSGARLDPIVVSARRQLLPGTFSRVESGASVMVTSEEIDAIPTNLYDLNALLNRSPQLRAFAFFSGSNPSCAELNGSPVFIDGVLIPRRIPPREWIRPYEIEIFEITRGSAALGDEARRRAGGDLLGPPLDPRIASCRWVWLIWTKDYMRRARGGR